MGYVDLAQTDRIAGWAADTVAPDEVQELAILVNGREAGRVKADRARLDLKRLGRFGEGKHGFEFRFEPPLDLSGEPVVVVRFADSDAVLTHGAFRFRRRPPAGGGPPAGGALPVRNDSQPTSPAQVEQPAPGPVPGPGRIGKTPAPRSPRALFGLLSEFTQAGSDLDRLFDFVELGGVTPLQVYHSVFQTAPSAMRQVWVDGYDPKAHFVDALRSPEFRARAIELFLRAFPEKRRLFFIHVPKCAGTDLRAKLLPKFASLPHSLTSKDWTPDSEFFAALGTAASAAESGKEILVFGHIELNRYVARAGRRFDDDIFTVIRDPVELAISQANYAITVLVNDPEVTVPHTRENLQKLGIGRLPQDAAPAQLKQLASRALLDRNITHPNPICSFLAGVGKGYAEAVRNIVTHNVEVTDTARYNRWLKERWGFDSATRHNSSIAFLSRADLEPHRDHLASLTAEDRKVFDLVSWALAKSGGSSIRGVELLKIVARESGPYRFDAARDEIVTVHADWRR